jgi:hypothetical protein
MNFGQIQNPSNPFGIVPLSRFVLRGFGFVHHFFCHSLLRSAKPLSHDSQLFHRSTTADGKKLRIVTLRISGGRSLTGPIRDARRFPSTRWNPIPVGYACDVGVWGLSIVQGPFSVAPCQTLALRFATFPSPYHDGRSPAKPADPGQKQGWALECLQPILSRYVSINQSISLSLSPSINLSLSLSPSINLSLSLSPLDGQVLTHLQLLSSRSMDRG